VDKASLGAACGLPEMSACGIADEGFARSLLPLAEEAGKAKDAEAADTPEP